MGKTFIKIAVVYFAIGVLLGMTMGMIHDFRFTSLHAHVNLLGWVSTAVFGLIYSVYPFAAETKLAKSHFWLHNIGLPVMMIGLLCESLGVATGLPVMIVGSLAVVIGTLIFMVNVLKNLNTGSVQRANQDFKA
ncbi:cbb3-type cytochrome c oxidase subunit I [Mesobacillus maritimus]|uniref:cbb3-type cytochrome c oxidase subunit I n=1 Tax=Mesobacillus maritimus TaxID=1643336 RepID=UPI002041173E|nr:cbb3-type cytochrome c oxidase subunit I [Mesobacillus maritimus]MCM3586960.1 cbb3-type cytochrome c oxidase subunit I [Mesobacillus maritimus]